MAIATSLAFTASPTAAPFTEGDCEGISAFISVPKENVEPLVPEEFALELNERGEAELLVNGGRCEKLNGATAPTTLAEFRVLVSDPPFTATRDPGHFQFWLVSDNAEMVELFRAGGAAAVHVPNLEFDVNPRKGKASLSAPPPTPSPFELEATVSEPVIPFPLELVLWSAVPSGVLKIDESIPGFLVGRADGAVTPRPGSEMDRVFCDDTDGSFAFADVVRGIHFSFPQATFVPQVLAQPTTPTGEATCE